jgi:translation initiation factor eIF-2B subunit alpha
MFPLSQRDLPGFTLAHIEPWGLNKDSAESGEVLEGAICDLTPPDLITLLFTDLGILTPSGISDELIQLFR